MTREELKQFPNLPGIYLITNNINNKVYVGQSITLRKRLIQHYNLYSNPRVSKKALYQAINKYGIENFSVSILEYIECNEITEQVFKILNKWEIYYIAKYNSFGDGGYNETKGGEAILGCNLSKKIAEKISKALKKRFKEHPEDYDRFRKKVYGYNYKEKYFIEANSRSELSKLLKEKGYNIAAHAICGCCCGLRNYSSDFVFDNDKEKCLDKLEFFNTKQARHSGALAPNYEEYFEYLKTIVDNNGYLPQLKDIAAHYNRANTTIIGWNKHIAEHIKLDKSKNRLMLINYK